MSSTTDIAPVSRSDRDLLAQHLRHPEEVQLPKRLQKLNEQVLRCREYISDPSVGPTRLRVIRQLTEEGFSDYQAEKIYALTVQMHGRAPSGSKHFHTEFIIDRIHDKLEMLEGSPKEYFRYLKLYVDVVANMPEDVPDLEDIRLPAIRVQYQPELLGIKPEKDWKERAERLREKMIRDAEQFGADI